MTQNQETAGTMAGGAAHEQLAGGSVKLKALFLFKEGMATVYDEAGESIPVTVLRYEPWIVSQIKTKEKDGYSSVQVACRPRKSKNSLKSEKGHLEDAGFEQGASLLREVRQEAPQDLKVGQLVSIESLAKGDLVKVTARSKGRGFAGVLRRHNFAGGPATHGAGFHRKPGSVGNRTWPGRVLPGKRMPGHLGDQNVTTKNVKIVEVLPQERVLLVKGPIPGARNGLIKLVKE